MNVILTTIGLDADDTLWHNERFFALTQSHFSDLLREYSDNDNLMTRLLAAERRNLPHYGFGIKGFTLSMIETAIEVTDGNVPAAVIAEILDAGRDMLSHPVELLPDVKATLNALKHDFKLLLITKGDLLDQERKLAQSGLRDHFDAVEIVSDKTPAAYLDIFDRHGTGADQGLMAGNSMASDVVPMIRAGGWGVLVPHGLTWAIEDAETPHDTARFGQIDRLAALPEFIRNLPAKQLA
ncbi:HAD hydrolase-like protein [Sulfitobacter sp. M57]|uniref:HAD family hydrolase n=1 Tax=unclassified Sulfitobacter TaxID=196795 RepID=UPI0023E1DAF1|nr:MULTISPECIES: HAD family hydrolase [unclassified Sulfitobacter]MDF3416270.1 HAD hydrolase-like protein [Sulfitobacter sp. KE5]MDF3423749.1 HAD hydrolase-like protein [Sulfitobacter sp. KE43]MDF3434816.1 HAD hydrolase-like protein [Sulfitobacter sp. KE42]MDF3460455.1 HAD hydrolase-like protein [Sulfitobacter sp. S74]MDF3464353.1 HAD hydrolase-like protein [Sulfitobacter sp. Ks18]